MRRAKVNVTQTGNEVAFETDLTAAGNVSLCIEINDEQIVAMEITPRDAARFGAQLLRIADRAGFSFDDLVAESLQEAR